MKKMTFLHYRAGCMGILFWLFASSVQAAPDINHWKTENGLKVYHVEVNQLPMVDIRLTFAAGSARDGAHPGLATLVSQMLNKGATNLDADQIAQIFESVGASYSASAARDMGLISLRTLTLETAFNTALDNWLTVIGQPSFPEDALENLRKLNLVGLKAQQQSPSAISSLKFYETLYGDHPYGSPTRGTEDSLQAMTRQQLVDFYQRYYVAENGVLALVGGLDLEAAKKLAARISAVLETGKPAPELPKVEPLTEAKTLYIPFPTQQAHIQVGQVGMQRGDDDYFSLYLGNHILGGGGLTSRISQEIREKRGLSYSAYSYFSPMAQNGPFIMGLQTRVDQTDEALQVMRDTLQQFVEKGPSANEWEAAGKNISGSFPLRTASNSDIIGYLTMIGFYDLPLDYLDTFTTQLSAVQLSDIKEAFQRRLQPDKMLTVIVGGAENAAEQPQQSQPAKLRTETNTVNTTPVKTTPQKTQSPEATQVILEKDKTTEAP